MLLFILVHGHGPVSLLLKPITAIGTHILSNLFVNYSGNPGASIIALVLGFALISVPVTMLGFNLGLGTDSIPFGDRLVVSRLLARGYDAILQLSDAGNANVDVLVVAFRARSPPHGMERRSGLAHVIDAADAAAGTLRVHDFWPCCKVLGLGGKLLGVDFLQNKLYRCLSRRLLRIDDDIALVRASTAVDAA